MVAPNLVSLGVAFYDHMRMHAGEYDARQQAIWYMRRKDLDADEIAVAVALADALATRATNNLEMKR